MISWWQMSLKSHHYYRGVFSLKEKLFLQGTVRSWKKKGAFVSIGKSNCGLISVHFGEPQAGLPARPSGLLPGRAEPVTYRAPCGSAIGHRWCDGASHPGLAQPAYEWVSTSRDGSEKERTFAQCPGKRNQRGVFPKDF